MSIQSEIDRLALAKGDLADAITSKGVTVPQGAKLDQYADLVQQISFMPTMAVQVSGKIGGTLTSSTTYAQIQSFMRAHKTTGCLILINLTSYSFAQYWVATITAEGWAGSESNSIIAVSLASTPEYHGVLRWDAQNNIAVDELSNFCLVHLEKQEDGTYNIQEETYSAYTLELGVAYTNTVCAVRFRDDVTTYYPYGYNDNDDGTWSLSFRGNHQFYGANGNTSIASNGFSITVPSDPQQAMATRTGLVVSKGSNKLYGVTRGGQAGQVLCKNGTAESEYGWADLPDSGVKSVNGQLPDETGNVQIDTGGAQILCGATDAVSVPSYESVNVALPDVPSSYHLVVGFEASQDGNQDINIFTGAQRMGGQWYAKAYNYGDTIQGKLTWVAFP